MQLPSGNATMTYTCQNSGDTYSSATSTCNNAQGKPQADSPWGQCSGGGVDATAGVTIYVLPLSNSAGTITNSDAQIQLTPYGGSGNTCFAITAPQSTQMQPACFTCSGWGPPTNLSTNYGVAGPSFNDQALALATQGMAIWVSGEMNPSLADTIGPNASVAINGVFYDPVRTVYIGATPSGTAGSTMTILTGTGSALNANGPFPYANGPTPCTQIDTFQVSVKGPANVNLAYCSYWNQSPPAGALTYLGTQDYNFLGSVQLVQ
jgi:hypothetical protein